MEYMENKDREFIGYFMGEGHVSVHKASLKTKDGIRSNYEPVIQIAVRADDLDILKWCKNRFGGSIYQYKSRIIKGYKGQEYHQNPVAIWRIQNRLGCLQIISILKQAELPSQKKKQIELFDKFLQLKTRGKRQGFQGKWFTDEEIEEQAKIKQKLSEMKLYVSK